MKEYIKILTITFGCLFFSCEEEVPSIGPVPYSFTKKVLIEEFTGAWCGYCPDGAHRLENTINANNGNVIGVNSAIISPSGGSIGLGFAIPSNLANNIILN